MTQAYGQETTNLAIIKNKGRGSQEETIIKDHEVITRTSEEIPEETSDPSSNPTDPETYVKPWKKKMMMKKIKSPQSDP